MEMVNVLSKCFEENGKGTFRYMIDGKPMQIEVPSDKYDEALKLIEERAGTQFDPELINVFKSILPAASAEITEYEEQQSLKADAHKAQGAL